MLRDEITVEEYGSDRHTSQLIRAGGRKRMRMRQSNNMRRERETTLEGGREGNEVEKERMGKNEPINHFDFRYLAACNSTEINILRYNERLDSFVAHHVSIREKER